MQIKIDIEVKPEELRRFLGLPDVVGIQEDIVHFLRDKVGAASENFDPASFVKENFQTLRNSAAWRLLFAAAKAAPAAAADAVRPKRQRSAAGKRRKAGSARSGGGGGTRTRTAAGRARRRAEEGSADAPGPPTPAGQS
jgi:hypothetical protein